MGRTDHYDDPDAPRATRLVVGVVVLVVDDRGRVLMIECTDNGAWALPGGGQEIGESVRDAAVRETREETGIDVEVSGIVGIYSDPGHVIAYDDGEVRQDFSICLRARAVGGTPTTSDESRDVRWVEPPDSRHSRSRGTPAAGSRTGCAPEHPTSIDRPPATVVRVSSPGRTRGDPGHGGQA